MEKLKIWYDPEGDLLEITFSEKPGEFRPTPSKNTMIKVDAKGQVIGLMVLKVSEVEAEPLDIELSSAGLNGIVDLQKILALV